VCAVLADSDLIGIVATTDLPRSRAFYADVLGLPIVEESPYACVFDAHGTMLRVTPVEQLTPAPYTVLGWAVADIAASTAELAARGVSFTRYDAMDQDEAGVWTSPSGAKIAWFTDPDRNTLSLTQF
jgi:catechol 2,3-dioxygenase-like lactoylglutathione lyase family enzyme